MARSGKHNIFEGQSDLVTDEALRKYRMAEEEIRHGREKKVSITLLGNSEKHNKEISRRQTGFVRPIDLTRMRQLKRAKDGKLSDDDSDDAALDDYLPYTRQTSIQKPQSQTSYGKKMAMHRKTGAIKPNVKEKKDVIAKKSDRIPPREVDKEEEIDERQESEASVLEMVTSDFGLVDEQEGIEKRESHAIVGWRTGSSIHTARLSDFNNQRRVSVLTRLIDDVSSDDGPGPHLKDFKPVTEQQQKKPLFLITCSPEKQKELKNMSDDSRELYLARRKPIDLGSDQQQKNTMDVLLLQHGEKVYRKISTDYVKTIDQIEQKEQTSLRTLEFAKHRPAISVRDYQKKNREYNETLAKKSKLSNDNMDNKKQ